MFSHSQTKGKARSQGSQDLRTVLGEGTRWLGDVLAGPEGLRIEGTLEGGIQCQGDVVVAATGLVKGTIQARRLSVRGQVEGVLKVETCLEILGSGRVEGEVELGTLVVDEGGILQGTCVHRSAAVPEKATGPIAPRRDERFPDRGLPVPGGPDPIPPSRGFDKGRF
jgi:cytoskeletal protein CcmA (bactofilin family)